MNALRRAIESSQMSQAQLARDVGVTPQALGQWLQGTRQVPAERCIAIETATGGAVTRYELRPDVFGPAPSADGQAEAA